MKKDAFAEYGNQKGLQEILEDLALYCMINMATTDGIRIILPQKVINAHIASFEAKTNKKAEILGKVEQTCGGYIYLHSIEGNEELLKELT